VIESISGACFMHDRLELAGWQVQIADAAKVRGLAPLACKTDSRPSSIERTRQRAAQRDPAAQGFVLKRVLKARAAGA
jgi:hypothetical protein